MRPRPTALVPTTLALLCASLATLPALLAPAGARAAKTYTPPANANNNTNNSNNNKAANNKPKPPEEPQVMKFLGTQRARVGGKDVLVVGAVDLQSGQTVQLPVPNNDPKSNKYDPKTDLDEKLSQFKPGDYVKVKSSGMYNEKWLATIEKYDMKAGEELPGNFVFYEVYSEDKTTPPTQMVRVQKFGQTGEFAVPMRPGDKKQVEPDPAILGAANSYKKGDIVTIEAGPGDPPTVRGIDLYKAPEEAKVGKVVEAEVAGDQKGPAVELDQNGTPRTLPIKGKVVNKKWQPDAQLLSRVKSLKAGTAVLFSTHDEQGKTYLKDIKVAPAQPAATPTKTGSGSKRFDK